MLALLCYRFHPQYTRSQRMPRSRLSDYCGAHFRCSRPLELGQRECHLLDCLSKLFHDATFEYQTRLDLLTRSGSSLP